MSRIRSLKNAIIELKKDDPNCDLTLSALRRKVLKKEIPYTKCGNKYLVDVDLLKDVLFSNKEVVSYGLNGSE